MKNLVIIIILLSGSKAFAECGRVISLQTGLHRSVKFKLILESQNANIDYEISAIQKSEYMSLLQTSLLDSSIRICVEATRFGNVEQMSLSRK